MPSLTLSNAIPLNNAQTISRHVDMSRNKSNLI
jgi:hypothetical protein